MLGPETSDVCLIRLCLDETKGNGVKHDQWGGVERVQCTVSRGTPRYIFFPSIIRQQCLRFSHYNLSQMCNLRPLDPLPEKLVAPSSIQVISQYQSYITGTLINRKSAHAAILAPYK